MKIYTISIFQKSESDSSSVSQPDGQRNLDLNNNENTDSTKETNKVSWHTIVMVYKPNGNGNIWCNSRVFIDSDSIVYVMFKLSVSVSYHYSQTLGFASSLWIVIQQANWGPFRRHLFVFYSHHKHLEFLGKHFAVYIAPVTIFQGLT